MEFRPCIDLRKGRVVQIVGGSLKDDDTQGPVTNFETLTSPADYARMYQEDDLTGGDEDDLTGGDDETLNQLCGPAPMDLVNLAGAAGSDSVAC